MNTELMQTHLKEALGGLYKAFSAEQIQQFSTLYRAIKEGSERMNLTTVLDEAGVARTHFADSLLPMRHELMPKGSRVIDVGSGAGLPGLPLKIARPDLDITLLDATEKKTRFITEAAAACGLDISVINGRAEEAAQQSELRAHFDICVSRAVARLDMLLELCAGFIKIGGMVLAYKGEKADSERMQAERCAQTLGLKYLAKYISDDPDSGHCVLVYQKTKAISSKYPRAFAQIKKRPL